jgi:hypothetical protein
LTIFNEVIAPGAALTLVKHLRETRVNIARADPLATYRRTQLPWPDHQRYVVDSLARLALASGVNLYWI